MSRKREAATSGLCGHGGDCSIAVSSLNNVAGRFDDAEDALSFSVRTDAWGMNAFPEEMSGMPI
jgi:hypothetical protein